MKRLALALAFAALLISPVGAQPVSFDAATLDALFTRPAKVEVNLSGPLLRMAAMGPDDPETKAMLRGLRGITVRVYDVADAPQGLGARLSAFGDRLAQAGWQTLVRVRPSDGDNDDVWIYARTSGDVFDGLTVMSVDGDDGEASFVFIDGPIDPSQVGRLGGSFGVSFGNDDSSVEDALEQAGEDREMAREAREEALEQAQDAREEALERAQEARDEALQQAREAREEAEQLRREAAEARRTPPAPPRPPRNR